jgi:integrase
MRQRHHNINSGRHFEESTPIDSSATAACRDVRATAVAPAGFECGSAVRDLIRRVEVPGVTFHGLRDTHASLLAKERIPLEVISRRLGHANIAITAARYLDVYTDRDAEAPEVSGKALGRVG